MKVELSIERERPPMPLGNIGKPGRTAAVAAATPAAEPPAISTGDHEHDAPQIDAAIAAANRSMQNVATNLQFEKDLTSGKVVVRVIDTDTQQVLRQMPSEEMLAMGKALERLKGLMIHLKV